MRIVDLATELNKICPTAYSHFLSKQKLPFICYLVTNSSTITADDVVQDEVLSIDVELYTEDKNLVLENQIKQMLKENEIAWDYDEQYLKSEKCYKCTFSIELIEEV